MSRRFAADLPEVPDIVERDRRLAKPRMSAFTATVPLRCSADHSSIEACPLERTNRSRLGQIGSIGSNRITRFQSV
jgi:hypothetical protein